jgi:hypothetical protein
VTHFLKEYNSMKPVHPLLLFVLTAGLALAACAPVPETVPAPLPSVVVPRPAGTDIPTPVAQGPSFDPATYADAATGFELDYPAGWMLESALIGERATQAQIASWPHAPGDPVTGRPVGSTLVSVTSYQWDPQNDLNAYTAQRRLAWESSGFTVVSEEAVTLSVGWPAVAFVVQLPEGQAFYLFTYVGARYVEVSGDGDLALLREIALTLRPIGAHIGCVQSFD